MTDDTSKIRRWLFAAALAAALIGLVAALMIRSGDGGAETAGSATVPTDADASAPDADSARPDALPAGADVDLTGTWAHKSLQTSLTDVPVGGEVEARTITLRITEVEQTDRTLAIRSKVCHSEVDGDSDTVTTRIPDAFVDGLPVAERRGQLEERNGELALTVDHQCDVYGADLDDPQDALPTAPDAPTVVDADGDGDPGVTVHLEGMISAKLNIAQRGCDSYVGRVLSEDRVRGTVDWSADQELLESNSMLVGSKPPSRPHPDAQKSWFEMRRVDEAMTCEQLMERVDEVF